MRLLALLCFIFLLSASNSSAQLVVGIGRFNVMYLGVDNRFDFAVKNVDTSLVELRASRGELSRHSDGGWNWRSCEDLPGKILLSAYHRKTKKLIGESEIRIKYMQEPGIYFFRSSIFAGDPSMTNHLDYPCEVTNYDITFKEKNITQTYHNTGEKFSPEIKKLIDATKNGDTVVITDLIVKCGCLPNEHKLFEKRIYQMQNGRAKLIESQD